MKLKLITCLFFVGTVHLKAQKDSLNPMMVRDTMMLESVKVRIPTNIHFVLTPHYHNGNGSRNFYIGNNTVFKPTSGSNNYYIEAGSRMVKGNQSWVGPVVLLNDGEKIIENACFTNRKGSPFTYHKERIVRRQKFAQSKFVTGFMNFMGALGSGFHAAHRHRLN